jgi:hypothetical protein
MSMWPSVLWRWTSSAVIAKRCGAPMRKAPKSPALWESGIVAEGDVPSWPMKGRTRVASATRSCGAKPRIGFCAEPSGSAAKRAASPAKRSASSRPTVTPRLRASSKAIV